MSRFKPAPTASLYIRITDTRDAAITSKIKLETRPAIKFYETVRWIITAWDDVRPDESASASADVGMEMSQTVPEIQLLDLSVGIAGQGLEKNDLPGQLDLVDSRT